MVKRSFKSKISGIYKFVFFNRFRYSGCFNLFRRIFSYSDRERMLSVAMEFVRSSRLEGDYLEFGVYEGNTFVPAFHFAQKRKLSLMKFYAFDSFEGLPDVVGEDVKGFKHFFKGQYACGVGSFKKIVSRRGVKLSKVVFVPGWFDKVLNSSTKKNLSIKKAAVVWVDCDLYESTVPVLNFITDYVQDGTVLIFDDWFAFRGNPARGEQKAFSEWLKKNPSLRVSEFKKFGWNGNSFIIHKNG